MIDAARSGVRAREPRTPILAALAVGAVTFWLGFDNGAYSLTTWAAAGITVWWAVALAWAGLLPTVRVSATARRLGLGLALLAVWSLLSAFWADDRQGAYEASARVTVYLGVFVCVAMLVRRAAVARWLDGLATGVVAVAVLALASRLFPSLELGRSGSSVLPAVVTRLSYPLGYWNGLAIFAALALPALLRIAVDGRTVAARTAAVAPLPALTAVIYLASSRGGAIVAAAGAIAFVLCSGRAWPASGAALSALAGSAVVVLALHSRHELVDGPLSAPAAVAEGRSAALLTGAAALVSAAVWLGLQVAARRFATPSRAAGRATLALLAVATAAAVALSHPVARFHAFEQAPLSPHASGFTASHLLSGSGSGRWQFWSSAIAEWKTAKIAGRGAGSFGSWWAQHGTISLATHDPHSLFLQALAELGVIGFALAGFVWLLGPALALARARALDGGDRASAAAAASIAAAFAVGAAIDWIWRLPAVAFVGVAALALACAPSAQRARLRAIGPRRALAALPLLVIVFELVPLLAAVALHQSAAAAGRGDVDAATAAALRAHALEPWAVSPLEQLALLDETRGSLAAAQVWIDRARQANGADWQVRLIAARIETKRGLIGEARADLARAKALNPRSPVFSPS